MLIELIKKPGARRPKRRVNRANQLYRKDTGIEDLDL